MPVPVPLLVPSGCRTFSSRGAFRDPAEANSARTQSSRKTAARLILADTGNRSPPLRVCLLFTLPHRDRAPAPAAPERHRLFPQLHPEIRTNLTLAGGGESPLLRSYRLGPPVRSECWREKQLGSNKSISKSRIELRLLLAAAERTLESSAGERVLTGRPGGLYRATSSPRVNAPAVSGCKVGEASKQKHHQGP